MDPSLLKKLKLKPLSEILQRLNDVIHKHRRRFITRNSKPCPRNCEKAHDFAVPVSFAIFNSEFQGKHRGMMCEGCGSHNPDVCKKENEFVPNRTKEQLVEQFKQDVRNPQILLRDYRDIAFFLWVVGGFDETVDESVIGKVEPHVASEPKSKPTPERPPLMPASLLSAGKRPAPAAGNKAGATAKAIGAPANKSAGRSNPPKDAGAGVAGAAGKEQ